MLSRLRNHPAGTSFHPRQSNIGRKRSRRRRLQKARCNPQREEYCGDPEERQSSLRPTDPDTHPPLSPGAGECLPESLERVGVVPLVKTLKRGSAARFD